MTQCTYLQKVTHCPILTVDQILRGQSQGAKEVQVQYDRSQQFTSMARQFKVMDDLKVHVYILNSTVNFSTLKPPAPGF